MRDNATPQKGPAVPLLSLRGVSKSFNQKTSVLSSVDLDIYQGEFFSILGPSGCGKSTLLRIVAGLTPLMEGNIVLENSDISALPAYKRPINTVFQSYALFPHLTIFENVAFGLRQEKLPRTNIRERVLDALALVKLSELCQRKPHQLSGGQQQRVALARALVKKPKLLLLDEPMAALDKKLREHMRFELVQIQQQTHTTFLMVTHDQEEAMSMSNRLAIMHDGRILQIGSPQDIYESPVNRQVAEFIGTANFLHGKVEDKQTDLITVSNDSMTCVVNVNSHQNIRIGDAVCIVLRPEKIQILDKPPQTGLNSISGRIRGMAYLGDVSRYEIALPDQSIVVVRQVNQTPAPSWSLHQQVYLQWQTQSAIVVEE